MKKDSNVIVIVVIAIILFLYNSAGNKDNDVEPNPNPTPTPINPLPLPDPIPTPDGQKPDVEPQPTPDEKPQPHPKVDDYDDLDVERLSPAAKILYEAYSMCKSIKLGENVNETWQDALYKVGAARQYKLTDKEGKYASDLEKYIQSQMDNKNEKTITDKKAVSGWGEWQTGYRNVWNGQQYIKQPYRYRKWVGNEEIYTPNDYYHDYYDSYPQQGFSSGYSTGST